MDLKRIDITFSTTEPCGYLPEGSPASCRFSFRELNSRPTPEEIKRFKFESLASGQMSHLTGVKVPACHGCQSCLAARINLENFDLSSSQQKKLHRFSSIVASKAVPPHYSAEIYELWHGYHMKRHGLDPAIRTLSAESFKARWLSGAIDTIFTARDKQTGTLISASFISQHEESIDLEFVAYDLEMKKLSPGISSILTTAQIAREAGIKHLYLGAWARNSKLDYLQNLRGLEIHTLDQGWIAFDPDTHPQKPPVPGYTALGF